MAMHGLSRHTAAIIIVELGGAFRGGYSNISTPIQKRTTNVDTYVGGKERVASPRNSKFDSQWEKKTFPFSLANPSPFTRYLQALRTNSDVVYLPLYLPVRRNRRG